MRSRAGILACSLLVLASLSLSTSEAKAQAYQLEASKDVPLLLLGAAVTSSFLFVEEAPARTCIENCDRSKINAFDRWAAGRYSKAWGKVGDIGVATTILFGPLVVMLEEGWKNGANDNVVVLEAVALTSALQVTMSWAVPRARPRVYGDDAPIEDRNDANAGRSFFSGHTADAVASVIASTRTLHRLGHQTLGWFVLGAGLAGSTLVGSARVLSGGHFPSDIIVGAMAGTAFGLALPWLHDKPVSVSPMGASGLMLNGAW